MTGKEALNDLRARMVNREQAIVALQQAGLRAQKRDWAMGETIHILSSVGETTTDGITTSPIGGYLFPVLGSDGEWGLMDGGLYAPVARFDALLLAVRGAIIWFTGLETIYLGKRRRDML